MLLAGGRAVFVWVYSGGMGGGRRGGRVGSFGWRRRRGRGGGRKRVGFRVCGVHH